MITDIQLHGDWSRAGNRYTETDVKLIKNEKAQRRLGDQFSNSEHDFDVHFYKGKKSHGWDNYLAGLKGADWVAERYGIDLQPSDDKVTILVTSNIGSPKYPLTPWMIAHRISHSLWRDFGFNAYHNIFSNLENVIGSGTMWGRSKWFGCAVGTMRSARRRTLVASSELVHDLFAQALIAGHVSLNHIENRVFTRKRWRNKEYAYFADDQVNAVNRQLDRLENAVYNVKSQLYNMYGGIIIV